MFLRKILFFHWSDYTGKLGVASFEVLVPSDIHANYRYRPNLLFLLLLLLLFPLLSLGAQGIRETLRFTSVSYS
jgi:hypothetical protein